ncbi:MAG: flagellar biosynthesis anti-sigma factor FlgM [Deltaproteobacteria bacterium]|nr:MAG: flagellar biosynthesis anti-sigma factor FlgM [Deltaproteobacteria bacterium]
MTVKIHNGKPLVPSPGNKVETTRKQPDKTSEGSPSVDQVKISTFAREAAQLKQGHELNDPARAQRVAELKQQVADGSYNPDPQKVAESLLKYLREQD